MPAPQTKQEIQPPIVNQETFQKMLELDKLIYENVIQAKALLKEGIKQIKDYEERNIRIKFQNNEQKESFKIKLNEKIRKYNTIISAYIKRQKDYRENTIYKLGKSIQDWANSTTNYLTNLWNTIVSSLGVVPLIVPAAWVIGTTVSIGVVTFFIKQYYSETIIDYNESLKLITDIGKFNPELADKMFEDLNKAKEKESKSGITAQIGMGAKIALIITGSAVAIGLVILVINKLK